MKYKVGDIVEFTDAKGGFNEIEDHGKVVMVGKDRYDGSDKYLIECYNTISKKYNYYAFYEDEIKGVKQ